MKNHKMASKFTPLKNIPAYLWPRAPKIASFVLRFGTGFTTFAVLGTEYMNHFSYLADGANTSLPTWNTAGIAGSAAVGIGTPKLIRMSRNGVYRAYRAARGLNKFSLGNVDVSFAKNFPLAQRRLIIGNDGEIKHAALLAYVEKTNAVFGHLADSIRLQVGLVRSRNGEPETTNPKNVNSLDVFTRIIYKDGQKDGRTALIGGVEPTNLVFLEIIPQSPEGKAQGESHFLMFQRPVYGLSQAKALYPVDGQIVTGEDGRYQVKTPYANLQELLVGFNLWGEDKRNLSQVDERLGPPLHPSIAPTSDEIRNISAARVTVTPETFNKFRTAMDNQKYPRDPLRSSHLIPASEVLANLKAGGMTSEIVTGLQVLALQHVTDAWKAAAQETSGNPVPNMPAWVSEFMKMSYANTNNKGPLSGVA